MSAAYMKIPGIKGECKTDSMAGYIDIESWSWGMSQMGSMHQGGGGAKADVSVEDFVITKDADNASANLMTKCCTGVHYPEVIIEMTKSGGEEGGRPETYLKITFTDVMITSISTSANSDGGIFESVGFGFGLYEYSYKPQKEDGTLGAEVKSSYDVKKKLKVA